MGQPCARDQVVFFEDMMAKFDRARHSSPLNTYEERGKRTRQQEHSEGKGKATGHTISYPLLLPSTAPLVHFFSDLFFFSQNVFSSGYILVNDVGT